MEDSTKHGEALPEGATHTNSIGMEFVLIPAGSFLMGSPAGEGKRDEHPQRRVTITRPFYLGKYPVTQAQWQAVMGANPSGFPGADNPVEQVSWENVFRFLVRINLMEGHTGYRLPSEAEWEYACRAGREGDVGQSETDWFRDNAYYRTWPVGREVPNPWGLYDMFGNVWEWVWDWYDEQAYAAGPAEDPLGPDTGAHRVRRGGWSRRPATRSFARPDERAHHTGFRLALSVPARGGGGGVESI